MRVSFQVLTKNIPYPIPIEKKKKKKDNPTFATAMKKKKQCRLKNYPFVVVFPSMNPLYLIQSSHM